MRPSGTFQSTAPNGIYRRPPRGYRWRGESDGYRPPALPEITDADVQYILSGAVPITDPKPLATPKRRKDPKTLPSTAELLAAHDTAKAERRLERERRLAERARADAARERVYGNR